MRARDAIALLALAALLAQCTARKTATPKPIRIATYGDPLTLDPHARNEVLTFSVLHNLYDALTMSDPGTRVEPALAESWENPNELTWIFHLRKNVRFHDGREFTAKDVLFSFDRARNAPSSNVTTYLLAIDKVQAIDPHTVEITTVRPYPILLNKLAFIFIVPAGSPAEIRQPIGTGPYRLVSYDPAKRIELRAFPGYWRGAPPEPSIDLLPITDRETRIRKLLAGEVDIAQEPGGENIERIRKTPHCRLDEQDSVAVTYLHLRADRPPFTDVRVRRALSLGLDRTALVRRALHGGGVPVGQMVSRHVFGFAPDIPTPAPAVEQAKALLRAAGYPQGLDLELQFRQGRWPEYEAIRDQLARIGVRVKGRERPWSELFPALMASDVDFYFGAWYCLSGDASDFFDAMAHSPLARLAYGASNFNRYSNPRLDALIEESETTLDLMTRRSQLEDAMHVLMEDEVYIPLYSSSVMEGVRDDIRWPLRRDALILAFTMRREPGR